MYLWKEQNFIALSLNLQTLRMHVAAQLLGQSSTLSLMTEYECIWWTVCGWHGEGRGIKGAYEKDTEGGLKLGRVQKSLRCHNCGTLGHNIKMCHRHLPPKTPAHEIGTKKRKLNSGDASSIKGTKPLPKTKNELRAKAQLRKVAAKDKRDAKRVAAKATGRGPPTKGRPPKVATSTVINASANTQPSQASSRSSVRIRANANKGGK
ncbi:hypothetical protein ACLB2K_035647 [Fragaria x ananassa]